MRRQRRQPLIDGRMVLVSPYDPAAGFNVGHAMQRNKLIYALSDAALVVNADLEKGGTWNGAVEQLEKFHLVPVFVRSNGSPAKALDALRKKGALPWPNPETGEQLEDLLATAPNPSPKPEQLSLSVEEPAPTSYRSARTDIETSSRTTTPSERLMKTVCELILGAEPPYTARSVAELLDVTPTQARAALARRVTG